MSIERRVHHTSDYFSVESKHSLSDRLGVSNVELSGLFKWIFSGPTFNFFHYLSASNRNSSSDSILSFNHVVGQTVKHFFVVALLLLDQLIGYSF